MRSMRGSVLEMLPRGCRSSIADRRCSVGVSVIARSVPEVRPTVVEEGKQGCFFGVLFCFWRGQAMLERCETALGKRASLVPTVWQNKGEMKSWR